MAIARTLAMEPEIVLFDEPTSALDPTMVSEVLAVIRRLAAQGLTMMIVTHEMNFARDVSSRIFYMDEGVIYEDGPPEQVFDHPQRDKTRAFIHKIKTWSYTIESRKFDLYRLNGELESFCQKHLFSPKQVHTLELVLEEMIVNQLLPHLPATALPLGAQVGYSEQESSVEAILTYGGDAYHPLQKGEDALSQAIVNQLTTNLLHTYQDGHNRLSFRLRV